VHEQSKAAKRRFYDGAFHNRYFVGDGIDIGGKPDPLGQYAGHFALLRSCRTWDLEDGDAQFLAGVPDNSFDFVHSSHCLEDINDVHEGLRNWIRVLKPGGYLIVTIPDEDLYEQGHFPSIFNREHKWTFTIAKTTSWSPRSINVIDLVKELCEQLELERLILHRDFYRHFLVGKDQSKTPVAELSIEIIWRKRGGEGTTGQPWEGAISNW
jgi:SAM-dependent methyltransferase